MTLSKALLPICFLTWTGVCLADPPEKIENEFGILNPEGVDSDAMRKYMSDTFKVEIAGAFGLPIIRIGQMGEQCRSQNLFKTLYALGMSYKHYGVDLKISAGMAAMEDALAPDDEHFVD